MAHARTAAATRTPRSTAPRTVVLSFVLDAVLVIAFTTTGRATHDEALGLAGVVRTAWPFVAALVIGWAASLAWRAPLNPWRTGVPLWLITLAAGMLLRVITGQGTAVPFILVAAGFLVVTLVGWRLIAAFVARRRRAAASHSA